MKNLIYILLFFTFGLNAQVYTDNSSGVYAALTSEPAVTITTGGTYYPITGTYSNDPIVNFTLVATPAIRYDNHITRYFKIDIHVTFQANSNGATAHVGVKKNGTFVSTSESGTYLKTANEPQSTSVSVVVELATNDEIQLVVTSDDDGDIITFKHLTTTINPFLR